jgi:hypothetical protein
MAKATVRQYSGDIRMWRKAADGSLIAVIPEPADSQGNQPIEVNAKTFSYEAGDEIKVVSKRNGSLYNQPIYTDTLPGTTSLSLNLLEIPPAIMARILYGTASDTSVVEGSVTDEVVTVADLAQPVQLPHRFIKATPAPVFTKGATPLVAGTDYTLDARRGQFTAIAGGALVKGDAVKCSYSYDAVDATRILGGATPTESFYVTGDMQDRVSGEWGELEVFEARLTVDGEVDWLASEPISPTLAGPLVVPSGAPAPYVFTSYALKG